ncbi:hypothetical protein ABZX39_28710 [Streptomyces collinus]|uniref:peptidase inhibitor family I36 protein n=1 Tax=Streptomyces collinus TaxID=42684 RepID=UPI0033B61745
MTFRRNIAAAAVALPVVVGSLFAATAPASAYASDNCLDSTLCVVFDYNSNLEGASAHFERDNVSNLAGYTFDEYSGDAGYGQSVKNNAASLDNVSPNSYVTIYFNSGYGGSCDSVPPSDLVFRLHNTYNNDASFKFTHDTRCYQF